MAMLVLWLRRCRLIARFLRLAITRGATPVLVWLASSWNVTSRHQWREFSIFQWPRIQVFSCFGLAWWAGNEVIR